MHLLFGKSAPASGLGAAAFSILLLWQDWTGSTRQEIKMKSKIFWLEFIPSKSCCYWSRSDIVPCVKCNKLYWNTNIMLNGIFHAWKTAFIVAPQNCAPAMNKIFPAKNSQVVQNFVKTEWEGSGVGMTRGILAAKGLIGCSEWQTRGL